jgi:glycosyltransferase involved in cell wall biosynthesis
MKIGIDLRPLQSHNEFRGIGRYISNLIYQLSRIDDKNYFKLYIYEGLDSPIEKLQVADSFNYEVKRIKKPKQKKCKLDIFFKQYQSIDQDAIKDIDVFFQPDINYGLPKKVRTVVVFYDLIPLLFKNKNKPNMYRGLSKLKVSIAENILYKKYVNSLNGYGKADKVIAISESSKKDLLAYDKSINSKNVSVVHLAVDNLGVTKANSNIKSKLPKDYILYVGGIDVRKNVIGLVKIFFDIKDEGHSDLKLVLVGKEFKNDPELKDLGWNEAIKSSPYKKDIILPGYVDDEQLRYYYKNAKAFVFPSKYEGFGLPVLEAMKEGTPVVAFNNSSIEEIAKGAAVLCNNDSEFKAGIENLLTDKNFSNSLIEAGYRKVNRYSWLETAKQTLDVIESVVIEKD